jgi:signal transduction histidine kinase
MFFTSSSDFNQRVSIKAAEFCEQVTSEMGAELHDEVVQKLAAMSFYIERIDRSATDPTEILTLTAQMRSDFNALTQAVRLISQRLNPVHSNSSSFNESITALCNSMQHTGQVQIRCNVKGQEKSLGQLTFTYLYRIVQELFRNAIKHSSAWHINVDVLWLDNSLVIEVEDDGININMDEIISALQNKRNTLQMRCHAIDAKLNYLKGRKGLLVRIEYSPLSV